MFQRTRPLVTAAVLVGALLTLSACEKPDYSFQTSPSAKALLGTTEGNVAYAPADSPPSPQEPPKDWDVRLELVVFTELENDTDSIRIVMQLQTERGKGFEVWLANERGTVARWSGGSTHPYNGVVCFQMKTEEDGEALPLGPGTYTATVVFRDVETGVVAARALKVTGNPPGAKGTPPGPESPVFRELLGCPRGS